MSATDPQLPREQFGPGRSMSWAASDEAMQKGDELIRQWQERREGCLEVLAAWMSGHPGSTLDDGLDAMVESGNLHDWPVSGITHEQ